MGRNLFNDDDLIKYDDGTNKWGFYSDEGVYANPRMVISESSVGIGTETPEAQLQLGDIYTSGGKNLQVGDDTYISDVDEQHALRIYSTTAGTQPAKIKLGDGGATIEGKANGNICLGKCD